ncbi:MAG: GIY-YIG nuclease family protein [Candidatus Saccharibacteria bacterium]|nr:GIY-YIG nuclease family protein [Candidatus Saccharibacteria bacterium]
MSPVRAKIHYVYVLKGTSSGKFYTGCTSDLRKRYNEHQSGLNKSTKNRGPYELIYYEACMDAKDAFTREKYLKTGMGKRYLKNRLKRFLALTG